MLVLRKCEVVTAAPPRALRDHVTNRIRRNTRELRIGSVNMSTVLTSSILSKGVARVLTQFKIGTRILQNSSKSFSARSRSIR